MDDAALARRFYSVESLRTAARRRLPRVLFDFCDGGAEDEVTLGRNERDFDALEIVPRMMGGTAQRALGIELFGRRLAMPLLIGPTGLSGALWPDGEILAARAAQAAGTVYCQSHGSTCTIEELAQGAPGPRWFQVFPYRDRAITQGLVERAQAAGNEVLVLTVDNQLLGQRERDIRNGFTIPPRVTPANLIDMALHLPWLLRLRRGPAITMANYRGLTGSDDIRSLGQYIAQILDPGLAWHDVAWIRSLWRGPFVLKGILHPEDARIALEHGVDGVIVSNHGGRQLDGAVSSIAALPRVAEAVGGRMAVLLDGGIRRGVDVMRALACGADACLIGRPHLWGLATAGGPGVARALAILHGELDRAMALAGIASIAGIGPQILRGHAPSPAVAPEEDLPVPPRLERRTATHG